VVPRVSIAQQINTLKARGFFRFATAISQLVVRERVKAPGIEVAGRLNISELFGRLSHVPLPIPLRKSLDNPKCGV
jgi:hypothetical protein